MKQPTRPVPPARTSRCGAFAVGLALLAGTTPALAEGYASYDNFNGATMADPARWLNGDRQRLVRGGALVLIQRDWGLQLDDSGLLNQGYSVDLKNPSVVTQMRASITVNDYEVTGCASNTSNVSTVQARLIGSYFNVGAPVSGSRNGDVVAVARLLRDSDSTDPAGVLKVEGIVVQCQTDDCNYDQAVLGQVDLGTATTGETLSLRLEWEPARDRFNFYRGTGSAQRVTYSVDDSHPASVPYRSMGNRTNLANCFSGPRTTGFIDAKYDNFAVNASAAP